MREITLISQSLQGLQPSATHQYLLISSTTTLPPCSSSSSSSIFCLLNFQMERYSSISTTSINGGGGGSATISPRTTSFRSAVLPPKPLPQLHNPRRLDADAELSIFDAQRYFSTTDSNTTTSTINIDSSSVLNNNNNNNNKIVINQSCDLSTNPRDSSVSSSVDTFSRNYRNMSYHATPTASSEASWNSQTGLLTNPPGASAVSVRAFPLNEHRKAPPFSPRRRFPRHCPCSGKKSIDVEEKYAEPKSPATTTTTTTTTMTMSTAAKLQVPRPDPVVIDDDDDASETETKMKILAENWAKERALFRPAGHFSPESRFTTSRFLESSGFSFPILKPQAASLDDPARDSLEVFKPNRRGGFAFPGSPRGVDDDVGSDASSDLFELESFSAYKRRDSLDDAAAAAGRLVHLRRSIEIAAAAAAEPSEGYAPSEVSVEWSVTTAEGFDRASAANFSSAASDYDETRFVRAAEPDRTAGKRRGSGLLSCVCEKAVSVGPNPVRFVPEQQRRAGPVGFIPGEPDRVHASLVRSNSSRMCRPMATR